MSWLLIAVILILAVCAVVGHKRGFIRTVFGIVSLILALALAAAVSPACSRMIRENGKVFEFVKGKVENHVEAEEEETKAGQVEAIQKLNVPKSIKKTLIEHNNKDVYESLGIDSFQDYLLYHITGIIINAAVFLILFLVCRLILWGIASALDLISRLPVLNELNRAAGVFAGILKGLGVLWVLCIVLTLFAAAPAGQAIFAEIERSALLSKIYDNNLLLETITRLF